MSQATQSSGKIAAFFDLDRTLMEANSASLYIQHERKHGRLGLGKVLQAGFYLMLYHFSIIDIGKAYRRAMLNMRGADPQEVQQRTSTWFKSEVEHLLLPGAKAALEHHRKEGHPCVLLTGSTEFLAREVEQAWPIDDWLANCFEVGEDGYLTGEVSDPLCYAEGKVHWAEQWSKEHDVDLTHSYFYSDSLSDQAMFERVQHPRIVNPDPKLRRMAHKRSWPILDWKTDRDPVV